MKEPQVCCVCLTADRQRFTDRAVRRFARQSYSHAHLLIFDTGGTPYVLCHADTPFQVRVVRERSLAHARIGALRNAANSWAMSFGCDLIAHWDSDDVSLPERLSVQVECIKRYGDLFGGVGAQNLLFWDSRADRRHAWEYRFGDPRCVVGTSLMYKAAAWDKRPFSESLTAGEDTEWCRQRARIYPMNGVADGPLVIADYHGANTNAYGAVEPHWKPIFDRHNPAFNPEWRRAPEWDARVGRIMDEE